MCSGDMFPRSVAKLSQPHKCHAERAEEVCHDDVPGSPCKVEVPGEGSENKKGVRIYTKTNEIPHDVPHDVSHDVLK